MPARTADFYKIGNIVIFVFSTKKFYFSARNFFREIFTPQQHIEIAGNFSNSKLFS